MSLITISDAVNVVKTKSYLSPSEENILISIVEVMTLAFF